MSGERQRDRETERQRDRETERQRLIRWGKARVVAADHSPAALRALRGDRLAVGVHTLLEQNATARARTCVCVCVCVCVSQGAEARTWCRFCSFSTQYAPRSGAAQ